MKVITKGARWKGLVVKRAAVFQVFKFLQEHKGTGRHDLTHDNAVKCALRELFELGRKTGNVGMKVRQEKLHKTMLEALMNLENDDGHIPKHAWDMVQNAIKKALPNYQIK